MTVALLALLGFVAGIYVRAVASGFEEEPADTRAEARRAFRAALRLPVPAWPPVAEAVTAAVVALIAWRAAGPYLMALVFAGLAGVLLAAIDWRTFRLPDVITLPAAAITALLLIPTGQLPRALLGAVALAAIYGVLWFVRPSAMGLGDVKLALLIGLVGAAVSWPVWVLAAVAGQVFGAVYAIGLVVMKKGDRKTEFPFGPFMLLGALAAICLT